MLRKRFQFPLEKVLHVRRHESDVAEQQLSDALQRRHAKDAELKILRELLQEASLARPGQGRVTSARLQAAAAQCTDVEGRMQRVERQLKQIDERVERARQKLARLKTAQESLEVLRDKHLQRFRTDEAAEETAALDEHALTVFLRR